MSDPDRCSTVEDVHRLASRLDELPLPVLTEVVQDAWLSRTSPTRARAWLAEHPTQ